MAIKMKYLLSIIVLTVFMSACGQAREPDVSPMKSNAPAETSTLEPSATHTSAPTLVSTASITPTAVSTSTFTPTQIVMEVGPFKHIASLMGNLAESTGEIQVRALADGSVWVFNNRSAMRWDGQSWEEVISEDEDLYGAVDDAGTLWILRKEASEVSAWQDGQWTTYGAESGWSEVGYFEKSWWSPTPWNVFVGTQIWIPLEREVRAFDGINWKVYSLEDMGFPQPDMEDISIDQSMALVNEFGEIWVGECYYSGPGPMGGGGVRWFDGQDWQGINAPIGSTCVSTLTVDSERNVWLGTDNTIWQYERAARSWTGNSMPEDLLSGYNFSYPLQLAIDREGDVWVIMQMCGGASCGVGVNLYRIHRGEWSLILEAQNWSTPFRKLVLDGSGRAWLFWEGMFYDLSEVPIEPVTTLDARGATVSPNGAIWVVAGQGESTGLWVMEP